MKNSIKFIIILLATAIIMSTVNAKSANVQDPPRDVSHWTLLDTGEWGWEHDIEDKPDIDILELTYVITDNQIILDI